MNERILPMPPLNEICRAGGYGVQKPGMPDALKPHFIQDGMTWHAKANPDAVAVVDRGHRMHTFMPESAAVVGAMVVAAKSRGWNELVVSGSEVFRRTAYLEAGARGMQVNGYEPSPADRSALVRRTEVMESLRDPMVQAYLTSTTTAERRAASACHPGLDRAFAAEDAARFAIGGKSGMNPVAAESFMARFRENVAVAIHKGRELPQLRTPVRDGEVRR